MPWGCQIRVDKVSEGFTILGFRVRGIRVEGAGYKIEVLQVQVVRCPAFLAPGVLRRASTV